MEVLLGGLLGRSPSRSLRPEVAAAAKSEGSTLGRGPFWVACHSRHTHSLGTNVSWDGTVTRCATGPNCVLGVSGEPKMVSHWQ